MYQSSRLQRVVGPLSRHHQTRLAFQIVVNKGQQTLLGVFFSIVPVVQNLSYFRGLLLAHILDLKETGSFSEF